MDQKSVTVVTPFYNSSEWLGSLLSGVGQQTLPVYEHVIVDDFSLPTEYNKLLQAAHGARATKVLRLSANSGPAVARNLAIRQAKGRFIAFLDADDLWHPDKLKFQIQHMLDQRLAFSFHDYAHVNSNVSLVGRRIKGPDLLTFSSLHRKRGTGGCLSVVIDREKLRDFQFPIVPKKYPEDFLAWAEIIKAGHIGVRLPKLLGLYRLHAGNRSAGKLKVVMSVHETYRHLEKLPLIRANWYWSNYVINATLQYGKGKPTLPFSYNEWIRQAAQ